MIDKERIRALMKSVFRYQVTHPLEIEDAGWERGTFYTGVMAAYHATEDKEYLDRALAWAEHNKWELNNNPIGYWFADNQNCGQTYLDLYFLLGGEEKISHTRKIIDEMVSDPPRGRDEWWWCDSLYMAPSVFLRLARATGDARYIDLMNDMWWDTTGFLYDRKEHLFFRDKTFFNQKTMDGKKMFW